MAGPSKKGATLKAKPISAAPRDAVPAEESSRSAGNNMPLLRSRLGPILQINVVPNAKRTEFAGWHDGRLRIRVAAPPSDGLANAALLEWLAGELHMQRSAVTLLRGASGRFKQVLVAGALADVQSWLKGLPASTDMTRGFN
jgi:uncharacterized protein (TIGR00251 family)